MIFKRARVKTWKPSLPPVSQWATCMRAPQALCLQGPPTWFNALRSPSQNLCLFLNQGSTFPFCTGPHKLVSLSCPLLISRPIFHAIQLTILKRLCSSSRDFSDPQTFRMKSSLPRVLSIPPQSPKGTTMGPNTWSAAV